MRLLIINFSINLHGVIYEFGLFFIFVYNCYAYELYY
ncbi:hypothetical protein MS8345_A00046 (plasmid) [Escherichia coli]|uniref:Uncharacterized protein n=7 Tax=Enterobacteriaceae TaxID=543 RepID=A0A1U9XH35_ECOLX|nr:hypothetical protein pGD80-2_00145 [Escherichia coli]ARX76062.1 hypothetical protein KJLKPALD_00185 [Enterobacter asburiae]ASP02862.1 hypothetical protein MS7884_pA0082 [Enterobacter hormaechei]AZM66813.1 hypothetical protein [Salmonella enterica subsp. enterica serovar Braenderup]AZM67161.1 hypothetical protein [Salmonella enterica subsp. enterica serovar Typhimurium var. 5-]AZM67503.1 hypothetical protein [Salmonella enterica subsp. enterica serovar 4,[5],12:i:-]QNI19018.1 hypothetical p